MLNKYCICSMIDSRCAHSALTEVVIGGAMQMHWELGSGFPEMRYQRSLAIELEKVGLPFQREVHRPVFYKDVEVGARRVDFLVADVVLVELKATTELTDSHYAQTKII